MLIIPVSIYHTDKLALVQAIVDQPGAVFPVPVGEQIGRGSGGEIKQVDNQGIKPGRPAHLPQDPHGGVAFQAPAVPA